MKITSQISKHLKEVYFGGNWTWSDLKGQLANVDFRMATAKIESFNTIAALVYHINYFTDAIIDVLKGSPLVAHDKFSYDHPPIDSDADWQKLLEKVFVSGETLSKLIEEFPDERLSDIFVNGKYGTYYRNFAGLIEHAHYHLGQIALMKKMIGKEAK